MVRRSPIQWKLLIIPVTLLLYAALWVSVLFRYGISINGGLVRTHIIAFTPVHALWVAVFFAYGLFEVPVFRRFRNLVTSLLSAMAVNVLLAVLYFYAQPNLILTPRRFLLLHALVSVVFVFVWYTVLQYVVKRRFAEEVYFVGDHPAWPEFETQVRLHQYAGIRLRGIVAAEALPSLSIGRSATVVFPESLRANTTVLRSLYTLRTKGVSFYAYHDFYEYLLRRVALMELDELWFLENITYSQRQLYAIGKRSADIVCGVLGLLIFVITFPLIALLIMFDTGLPIFFIQERVGKDGRPFRVYKYRSMKQGGVINTWTSVNDPRLTRVGRFLRKARLDELPQCINLLAGTMSLVGPRPEQAHIVRELETRIPFYGERHLVKPGITGWGQIHVYAGSFEETKLKLEYDLYYIKHRSFLFDAEIILKTLYYIFTWSGR